MAGAKPGRSRATPKQATEIGVGIVKSEASDPVRASVAGGSGRVLTRADVARRLGMSLSSVRRMEGKVLNPVVGARGVRYFAETEIEAVFIRICQTHKLDTARMDGIWGAEAFALFRDGADPIEAVKRLEIGPDRAERLFRHWRRFGEAMVLDRTALARIEAALSRFKPIEDEHALILAIFDFKRGSSSHCVLCHESHARLCQICAREAARAALAEEDARKLV
jgi:hypothetical protein